jgi:hypothetical protein
MRFARRRFGTIAEMEKKFVADVKKTSRRELCYVVVGTRANPVMVGKIRRLGVPVVADAKVGPGALILAGTPDEWKFVRP